MVKVKEKVKVKRKAEGEGKGEGGGEGEGEVKVKVGMKVVMDEVRAEVMDEVIAGSYKQSENVRMDQGHYRPPAHLSTHPPKDPPTRPTFIFHL